LIDTILNLVFPVTCVVCNAQVLERRWGAACPDCWSRLIPVPRPICAQCGTPAPAIEGLCGRCRKGEHAFDFARSVFLFTMPLREILHHLKYADRVSLARPLSQMLRRYLDNSGFTARSILPVPLHFSRFRERGFNQAELLSRALGLPMYTRLLRRRKRTPAQTGLTRDQRQSNLAGAFSLRGKVPASVIVVDDVYTTGSTVNEIAKTLKRAGTERVEVLTVARVEQGFYDGMVETESETDSVSRVQ
jgi:ComF family protein